MTETPQPVTPPAVYSPMEDEIDLREYLAVLIKYWRWIVGFSVIAAIVAFIVTSVMPKTYEAKADVIILKSKATVSFEPKIQTGLEDQTLNQTTQKTNQETLVSLVTSNDLAATVLAQAGDLLEPERRNVLDLLKKVEAENISDVISISVKDKDPEVAAKLATMWAQSYQTYVNTLYGNQSSGLMVEVQSQADAVGQEYKQSQADWENFLATNRIAVLQREMGIKQERAVALKDQELATLNREISIKQDQTEALRNEAAQAQKLPIFLFNQQQETTRQILANKYDELRQINQWLEDAQTMKEQLAKETNSPSANAGNALALIYLRSKVLASSAGTPVQLQISFADFATSTVSVADVDSLIKVIDARKTRDEQDIEKLSKLLLDDPMDISVNPSPKILTQRLETMDNEILVLQGSVRWYERSPELSQLIDSVDNDIRRLDTELEVLQAQQRELKQNRDLAWENYTTVQRKLAEVQLAAKITDSQVRVAANAVAPDEPVFPRRLLSTAIAGVLGLMLSVFGVFAVEFWQTNKDTLIEPTKS